MSIKTILTGARPWARTLWQPLLVAVVMGTVHAAAPIVREARVSWGAVTQDVEGNTISGATYNVYQGDCGASKAKVASGIPALTYTASGLPAGKRTCFNVSANANGLEGGLSAEGGKTFPGIAPASVGALTVD